MTARNTLTVEDGILTVTPRGMDRVWGFRSRVQVPLGSITNVSIERDPHRVPTGLRAPGLDFMGKLCGTFHVNGERRFWNYSGTGEALEIELAEGQHFRRLYLSVADAEDAQRTLRDAVGAHS